jgi:hypothetical protein
MLLQPVHAFLDFFIANYYYHKKSSFKLFLRILHFLEDDPP